MPVEDRFFLPIASRHRAFDLKMEEGRKDSERVKFPLHSYFLPNTQPADSGMLPPGWEERISKTQGVVYYFNTFVSLSRSRCLLSVCSLL